MNNHTNDHSPWWQKAIIGAIGGVCLSLLKLIEVKFYVGNSGFDEIIIGYLTYTTYIILGMIVAVFFTDHELPKQKREKNALILGLLVPSILIAIVTSPVREDRFLSASETGIPELEKSADLAGGNLFLSDAYAQDNTSGTPDALSETASGNALVLGTNKINPIQEKDVRTPFGILFLKAIGRKIATEDYTLVIGTTESEEMALSIADKINSYTLCDHDDNGKDSNCAKVVRPSGAEKMYVTIGDFDTASNITIKKNVILNQIINKAKEQEDPLNSKIALGALEQGGEGDLGPLGGGGDRGIVGDIAVVDDGFGTLGGVGVFDVPQPPGDRDDVDGGIAAADADDLVGGHLHAAFVEGLEEGDAGNAVGGVFPAGYRKSATALAAQGPEDGVIVLFQVRDLDVGAYLGAELDLDAHGDDAVDFRVQLLARHAIAGDAVAEHAAEPGVGLEDGAGVAHAAQLVGRRQPRGPTADDGDLLAGVGAGLEAVALGNGVVADVLLDGVDADEVLELVAVAAVLTGGGADPAHHGGEGIGVGGTAEGVFLPVHPLRRQFLLASDGQPAANVLAGRAATLAGGRFVHIGGTLVRGILDEDLFGQVIPGVLAVLVPTPGKLGFHFVAGSRHRSFS